MKSKLLGSLALALHAVLALGQTKPTPADGWQTTFFESPTTALPLLITAALQHSPQLRGLEVEKSINQEDIKLTRKNILNSVAVSAGYTYGNLISVGNGTIGGGSTGGGVFDTPSTGRYSTGVSLSLPIEVLASRGNRIHRSELLLERTETERQARINLLREQVIQLYQNVVLARKVLTLRQDALVNVRTTYQLAERQFRQGQLALPAFSEASSQITETTIAQENARNQYDTAFMLLEETVGTKISTLMTAR